MSVYAGMSFSVVSAAKRFLQDVFALFNVHLPAGKRVSTAPNLLLSERVIFVVVCISRKR